MSNIISLHGYESYGSELVINGKFESDLRNWTGSNWIWSPLNGGAVHVSSTTGLTQSTAVVVAENMYELKFSVSHMNFGSVVASVGGASLSCNTNLNTSLLFKASSSSALAFIPSTDFDGIIDGVSLKRIIGGVFLIDGTVFFNGPASFQLPDGSSSTSLVPIEDTFVDADLTAAILSYTHNLGQKYVNVLIFDDADKLVLPDEIIPQDVNTVNVDLTSLTVTGTWTIRVSR